MIIDNQNKHENDIFIRGNTKRKQYSLQTNSFECSKLKPINEICPQKLDLIIYKTEKIIKAQRDESFEFIFKRFSNLIQEIKLRFSINKTKKNFEMREESSFSVPKRSFTLHEKYLENFVIYPTKHSFSFIHCDKLFFPIKKASRQFKGLARRNCLFQDQKNQNVMKLTFRHFYRQATLDRLNL